MKHLWIVIVIGAICGYAFWPKKSERRTLVSNEDANYLEELHTDRETSRKQEISMHGTPPGAQIQPAPTQAPPTITPTAPHPQINKKEEVNPYHIDRFTLRKLDWPQPKSVADLLSHLTEYKDPKLPAAVPGQAEDGDGDILTMYRGYYESAPGVFKRMKLDRVAGEGADLYLSIQNESNKFDDWVWKPSHEGFQVRNFNRDPYSLVIKLPDNRILYLKFFTGGGSSGYGGRMMQGWMIAANTKSTSRIILFGDYSPEDAEKEEEGSWPKLTLAKKYLPKALPVKN